MNFKHIMDILSHILALSAVCVVFRQFEPIQNLFKLLYKAPGKLYHLIADVLTCTKCFSLWASAIFLLMEGNFTSMEILSSACSISIISQYLYRKLNQL